MGERVSQAVGFEVSKVHSRSTLFLFLNPEDVKFLATSPVPDLPICSYASHHNNSGLNF